ncbi:uncharacterized protein LOC115232397 [Octopus sinensis]|nr:uncharacterized protein LOC115232397 [Octopus sinensis]
MKKLKYSCKNNGRSMFSPAPVSLYPKKDKLSSTEKKQIQTEYGQLQEMVPTIANRRRVTKRQVVREATLYIDQLHSELLEKLHHNGFSDFDMNLNSLNNLVINLMQNNLDLNKPSNTLVNK